MRKSTGPDFLTRQRTLIKVAAKVEDPKRGGSGDDNLQATDFRNKIQIQELPADIRILITPASPSE